MFCDFLSNESGPRRRRRSPPKNEEKPIFLQQPPLQKIRSVKTISLIRFFPKVFFLNFLIKLLFFCFCSLLSSGVVEGRHRIVGDGRQDLEVRRGCHDGGTVGHRRRRGTRRRLSAVAAATGKAVCWTAVLALVEVPLHVPAPAEGLSARGAAVSSPVNVTMVLQ